MNSNLQLGQSGCPFLLRWQRHSAPGLRAKLEGCPDVGVSVRSREVGAVSGHRTGGWREAVRREAQADPGSEAGQALLPGRPPRGRPFSWRPACVTRLQWPRPRQRPDTRWASGQVVLRYCQNGGAHFNHSSHGGGLCLQHPPPEEPANVPAFPRRGMKVGLGYLSTRVSTQPPMCPSLFS